ncbi:hypothetical protein SRABI26_00131 [Arthrobacter sp. Bi26]|uniref:hypothetical protein n=1 Tax=Arthrobacter sp. Bi26 TaxID=2822350 RepID=UPI001DDF63EA|nr:hypothetical protein [Arthrobacter sp. Bi26]CAH0127563.1 hypothetical protein SRABI26_00131 [Arthrobacter sp. Bi26]
MSWYLPAPQYADEATGTTWCVCRAWFDKRPGDYVLEVLSQGRTPALRGAYLRHGRFELVPLDDPELPALRAEAQQGELIAYRPHRRAVVRAEGRYIKIFRPGQAIASAERCAHVDILLDAAGTFTTPRILRSSEDVIVFSTVPGPTLNELGENDSTASDESFAWAWEKWSRSWVAQLSAPHGSAARSVLNSLPLRSAEVKAADLWRSVNRWLRHFESVPEMSPQGSALRAAAEDVTTNLLRSAPDPLVWSHGDLHGKQIIAVDGRSPLGLLDLDKGAQAEAALDLANMDVRLELHRRRNRMSSARYLTAHNQVLAVAEELHVNPDRFHAYMDALWLREALVPLPGRLVMATAVLDERAKHQTTKA